MCSSTKVQASLKATAEPWIIRSEIGSPAAYYMAIGLRDCELCSRDRLKHSRRTEWTCSWWNVAFDRTRLRGLSLQSIGMVLHELVNIAAVYSSQQWLRQNTIGPVYSRDTPIRDAIYYKPTISECAFRQSVVGRVVASSHMCATV